MSPKWARLMIRSTPHDSDRPAAMRACRPPSSMPVSAACKNFMTDRPAWRSARRWLDGGGSPLGRPDDDPVSILDLLEPRRGRRPEVVLGRIEGQVTAERRVGSRLVQRVADRLVVDAARRLDPRHEDLPGVPRS